MFDSLVFMYSLHSVKEWAGKMFSVSVKICSIFNTSVWLYCSQKSPHILQLDIYCLSGMFDTLTYPINRLPKSVSHRAALKWSKPCLASRQFVSIGGSISRIALIPSELKILEFFRYKIQFIYSVNIYWVFAMYWLLFPATGDIVINKWVIKHGIVLCQEGKNGELHNSRST